MVKLLQQPRATLARVEECVTRAFLRLYRQRNLVLHGGQTESECVALQATLRTAAPLVGAAFDRITHAWLEHRIEPMELAAKAQIRIDTFGGPGGRHVTELLE